MPCVALQGTPARIAPRMRLRLAARSHPHRPLARPCPPQPSPRRGGGCRVTAALARPDCSGGGCGGPGCGGKGHPTWCSRRGCMAMPRPRRVCAESSNMEEPLRRGCDGASPWRSLPRWLNLWGDAAAEPRELLSAPLLEAVPPPPPPQPHPRGGSVCVGSWDPSRCALPNRPL